MNLFDLKLYELNALKLPEAFAHHQWKRIPLNNEWIGLFCQDSLDASLSINLRDGSVTQKSMSHSCELAFLSFISYLSLAANKAMETPQRFTLTAQIIPNLEWGEEGASQLHKVLLCMDNKTIVGRLRLGEYVSLMEDDLYRLAVVKDWEVLPFRMPSHSQVKRLFSSMDEAADRDSRLWKDCEEVLRSLFLPNADVGALARIAKALAERPSRIG